MASCMVKASEWLKYKPLQDNKQKIAAAIFAAILALFAVLIFVCGVVPFVGRSMLPTIEIVSSFGLTSNEKDYQVNDLVVMNHKSKLGYSIKRIKIVDGDKAIVVGDNKDRSMDSEFGSGSEGLVWIPLNQMKKVKDIWSFKRFFRAFTPTGRVLNSIEFRYPPKDYCRTSDQGFLVEVDDSVYFYDRAGELMDVKLTAKLNKKTATVVSLQGIYLPLNGRFERKIAEVTGSRDQSYHPMLEDGGRSIIIFGDVAAKYRGFLLLNGSKKVKIEKVCYQIEGSEIFTKIVFAEKQKLAIEETAMARRPFVEPM